MISTTRFSLTFAAAFAGAMCAAGGALAAPPQPIDGAPLKWLIQPGPMRTAGVAFDYGSPRGWAEVECVINRKRRPDDCVLVDSDPAGGQIESLVPKIARLYVAAETDEAGQPSEGRRVRFGYGITRYVSP